LVAQQQIVARKSGPTSLADAFERVVVINLARRPERLERFRQRLEGNWPFTAPARFDAVDGANLTLPAAWKHGAGAWGCLQSHLGVLRAAVADRVKSVLILEDDAYPADGFSEKAADFLSRVPKDWSSLMLGAEHVFPPMPVSPGVVQCTGAIRCHAYALRGPLIRMFRLLLERNPLNHCDMILCTLMRHYKTYAPDTALIGQDAGLSDIEFEHKPLRFWPARQSPLFAA
jgi:hypothetical protein